MSAAADVLTDARTRIRAALEPHLAGSDRAALIGGAMHPNTGDHVILLGTLAHLDEQGVDVGWFVGDPRAYSREALDRHLAPGDPLVIRGGGSVNDLWPGFQQFRERLIADNHHRRIIQLPQSIHFRDPANADRFADVVRSHGGVTLLTRDKPSTERAHEMGIEPVLCPDSALYLPARPKAGKADIPVLLLARTDREAAADWSGVDAAVPRFDWVQEPTGTAFDGRVAAKLTTILRGSRRLERVLFARQRIVSERILAGTERVLSRARVVVTDRLHGHLICLLMEQPHVIVDNSDGKVRAFYDAWTRGSDLVRFAESPEEAIEMAQSLAAQETRA